MVIGDSGFSTNCSEQDAINLLMNEGCSIGADLIVIQNEEWPNFLSSCYRCSATFYQYNPFASNEYVATDNYYSPQLTAKRAANQNKTNKVLLLAGWVVGFTIGFLLFM